MSKVCFLGTYKPIVCGIGDYTTFLTRVSPPGSCHVITFNLEKWDGPVSSDGAGFDGVWYGLPSRDAYGAESVRAGLDRLNHNGARDYVLWFQHEHGIWRGDKRFIHMLRDLHQPKIVTFHTLHFQSSETPTGLRADQVEFLRELLPHVDAITVFSLGVYRAVTSAFPEYRHKVYGLKHGVHSYPEITSLSRGEARRRLHDFLVKRSDLAASQRYELERERVLLDPKTIVIGQAGFLDSAKQTEFLYWVRTELSRVLPHARIVAMRIGSARDDIQRQYAASLRQQYHNGTDSFLIETLLTENMLPTAQRAFDVNFYWPRECTQSGALSHALGAGAIIAGRDLEGVGETLRDAGQIVDRDPKRLAGNIREALLDPDRLNSIEASTAAYARLYSWDNQIERHLEIADSVLKGIPADQRADHLTFRRKTTATSGHVFTTPAQNAPTPQIGALTSVSYVG